MYVSWSSVWGIVALLGFTLGVFLGTTGYWVIACLELGVFSIVFCFFGTGEECYYTLFTYVLVSLLSGVMLMLGFLWDKCVVLSYVGMLLKFGLFPFVGWVYLVFIRSNWVVVWAISTLGKASFIWFAFGLGLALSVVRCVDLISSVTFFFVSCYFWVCTYSWKHYWCHLSIVSGGVFLLLAVSGCSAGYLSVLFLYYVFWVSFCLPVLSRSRFSFGCSSLETYLLLGLLVSYPLSMGVLYKILVSYGVYSWSVWSILGWVAFSISEQFYLLKFLFSSYSSYSDWGGAVLV